MSTLSCEVLELLQVITTYDKLPTVVFLSYGCDGPVIPFNESKSREDFLPSGAGVRGLVRTARIELPRARLLCIDTDALRVDDEDDRGVINASEVALQVKREIASSDGNSEVAYRGGVRWVRTASGPPTPSIQILKTTSHSISRTTSTASRFAVC